jgi:hypothetical protein
MKRTPLIFLCVLLLFAVPVSVDAQSAQGAPAPKTVIIKTPASMTLQDYFSSGKDLSFWIYSTGGSQEMQKFITAFKTDANVLRCDKGSANGDYQEIMVGLKSSKDYAWFRSLFQKAGLQQLRFNHEADIALNNTK